MTNVLEAPSARSASLTNSQLVTMPRLWRIAALPPVSGYGSTYLAVAATSDTTLANMLSSVDFDHAGSVADAVDVLLQWRVTGDSHRANPKGASYGDRRLPVPGMISVIAAALATVTSDTPLAHAAGALALVALLVWLAIYIRISAPINKRLTAAAINHTTPPDTRNLQQRWDTVIWTRAILQTVALAGLLTILLSR